jgi:hypothetical protein
VDPADLPLQRLVLRMGHRREGVNAFLEKRPPVFEIR